ncbi:SGNH/GDSL hydrolase family protein [Streptomyces camelliae]|uniref:SGNH/GDSL hydrolase family protein n=1 Tax=Streptomyces camelliae TaxID=3004093 RepID=A0ABY7NUT7_9ACTN|nr:SGNH/GDSL hydrolase family protein [Streptomyces sp. HUAS 2-6]WBO61942.1 SGNH/GDSL hydrolase family protein [Streptomyces sp. HUAS 2-6]
MPRAASTSTHHTHRAPHPRKAAPHAKALRRWTSALAGGLLLATASATAAHATASDSGESGTYVALGDSYAAGAGVPAQSAGLCMRSDHDYGHLVAQSLAPPAYRDVTCAGAKVSALTTAQTDAGAVVNGPQLDAVTPDTSLVTLTVAGDNLGTSDFGFGDVAATCSALSVTDPLGTPCRDYYQNTLSDRLNSAAAQLGSALQLIHAHAPQARVLVVGYPAVLPDDPGQCLGKMPVTTGDIAFPRSVLGELDDTVATTARAEDATYVDTLTPTLGHDSCSSSPWIEGLIPTSPALSLHPNGTGEHAMADAVLGALGR